VLLKKVKKKKDKPTKSRTNGKK